MRIPPLPHLPPSPVYLVPTRPIRRTGSRRLSEAAATSLRILKAEARFLETLADAAARHICDPRWLKAAARKESAAAKVLRALERCELGGDGRGGDKGEPAAAPEFRGNNLQPFLDLLERHNRKKALLKQWRTDFQGIAGALARFVKTEVEKRYAGEVYPHVAPEGTDIRGLRHGCREDRDALEEVFADGRGGVGANEQVFDPFRGRWHGRWTSGDGPSRNSKPYHVWDETRKVERPGQGEDGQGGGGEGTEEQWVQPVTQSTTGFVGADEIDSDPDQEGVQPPPYVDLAINVYGSKCGITGFVLKPDPDPTGEDQTQVLPCLGYRLGNGVIIWITQLHHPDCTPWSQNEPFILFYEWAHEGGPYGILGKRFRLRRNASGGIDTANPIDPVQPTDADPHGYPNEHHGGLYFHP